MNDDGRIDILHVGPYPPPRGGVAVYVQRLVRRLDDIGVHAAVVNHFASSPDDRFVIGTVRRNPVLYWARLRRTRARLVHYHQSRYSTLLAVAHVARKAPQPFVLTVHGHGVSTLLDRRLPPISSTTAWALRQFDAVVAVSDEVAERLAPIVGAERISVIPAYLPPHDEPAEAADPRTVEFVAAGAPTFVASAYRVTLVGAGRDLYGLDTAVEAFLRVAARRPSARLAIFVAMRPKRRREREYVSALLRRVADAGLERAVRVQFGEPLLPALVPGSVFLRPTRSDGDAVSLREALALGVPALASDAVERPQGTVVTPVADAAALAEAMLQVRRPAVAGIPSDEGAEFFARTLAVYDGCLGTNFGGESRPPARSATAQ